MNLQAPTESARRFNYYICRHIRNGPIYLVTATACILFRESWLLSSIEYSTFPHKSSQSLSRGRTAEAESAKSTVYPTTPERFVLRELRGVVTYLFRQELSRKSHPSHPLNRLPGNFPSDLRSVQFSLRDSCQPSSLEIEEREGVRSRQKGGAQTMAASLTKSSPASFFLAAL
jgi:hypothetical protein